MKKIALFMIPSLTHGGGAEKYFIELANYLANNNFQVDLITLNEIDYRRLGLILHLLNGNLFQKLNMTPRESISSIQLRLGQASWLSLPWNQMKRRLINYDLIYSKNELIELISLFIFGFKQLPPVIIGCHTPILFNKTFSLRSVIHNWVYLGPIYRFLLSRVKLVHVSNSREYELIKKWRIKSVKIPYPLPKIATKSSKPNSDLKDNIFQIVMIGRLTEQKGIDQLPDLCKKLNSYIKINEKFQLNIFGIGDQKNTFIIDKLVNQYPWIKYHGYVEHHKLLKDLPKYDLLISFSRWEVFPYSILETQTLGIPVIAYDIPGPQDIIINRETGFLVKNNIQFVKKIIDLLKKKVVFDKKNIMYLTGNRFNQQLIYSQLKNMLIKTLRQYDAMINGLSRKQVG